MSLPPTQVTQAGSIRQLMLMLQNQSLADNIECGTSTRSSSVAANPEPEELILGSIPLRGWWRLYGALDWCA